MEESQQGKFGLKIEGSIMETRVVRPRVSRSMLPLEVINTAKQPSEECLRPIKQVSVTPLLGVHHPHGTW